MLTSGGKHWEITLAPLSRMQSRGATAAVVVKGNTVKAHGYPKRDGTPEMRVRLERVLTNDPGIGVARHADAGYDAALATAEREGIRLPMREG
jgi:urocanate hydratase